MGVTDAGGSASHWLVKSEPDDYSFMDLERDGRTPWDGIRNYQARNFMRDGMAPGHLVLFYHSNITEPGVVGVARVISESYPDATQFDPASRYYDPKSLPEQPRWLVVDVEPVRALPRKVTLAELRRQPSLAGMRLLQRGNRLSVMPLSQEEFTTIATLADRPASG